MELHWTDARIGESGEEIGVEMKHEKCELEL